MDEHLDDHLDATFDKLTAWPAAVSIADSLQPDCPLIFVNAAFTQLVGYSHADCVGRNCRFLQGPKTDSETVSQLRDAVSGHHKLQTCIYNYRKDGSGFHNLLVMAPMPAKDYEHLIMGCQYVVHAGVEDEALEGQLAQVNGAFRQIERPGDMPWQIFKETVETRSTSTQMLVESYMSRFRMSTF